MIRELIGAVFWGTAILLGTISANASLNEDLVFYLTFDEITDQRIVDKSGNGLDAEIFENTEIVKGKYGKAIRITGQRVDCVNIASQEKLKVTGEITMMLWIYYPETWIGKKTHWFDKDCHTAGEATSYGIQSGDIGGGPLIWLYLGSRDNQGNVTGRKQMTSPHKMVPKKWHHVAGSYDGETMKIYVDGKVIGEEERKFNLAGDNDADVRIGCVKDIAHATFVNGSIDETAVWQRALSDDEIKQAMGGDFLAVSPSDKVATTWANIKRRGIAP